MDAGIEVGVIAVSGDWDYLLGVVVADVGAYNEFLMRTLLGHASVAGASSHFALQLTKYTTALPVLIFPATRHLYRGWCRTARLTQSQVVTL